MYIEIPLAIAAVFVLVALARMETKPRARTVDVGALSRRWLAEFNQRPRDSSW